MRSGEPLSLYDERGGDTTSKPRIINVLNDFTLSKIRGGLYGIRKVYGGLHHASPTPYPVSLSDPFRVCPAPDSPDILTRSVSLSG